VCGGGHPQTVNDLCHKYTSVVSNEEARSKYTAIPCVCSKHFIHLFSNKILFSKKKYNSHPFNKTYILTWSLSPLSLSRLRVCPPIFQGHMRASHDFTQEYTHDLYLFPLFPLSLSLQSVSRSHDLTQQYTLLLSLSPPPPPPG